MWNFDDSVCLFAEEMSNLKGEMKILEEKNMMYMQKTLDLEEVRVSSPSRATWIHRVALISVTLALS